MAPINELIKIACPTSTPIRDEMICPSHHPLRSGVEPPDSFRRSNASRCAHASAQY